MQFVTFVTNCIPRTLANMIMTDYDIINLTYEVGLMRQNLLLILFLFYSSQGHSGKLMQFT
jgi:hypothetical protein